MRRLAILLGVVAVVVGVAPGTAAATPGWGVSGTTLFQRTVGGTEYTLRELTIQPGGHTGWHYHDGPLYVHLKSGTLTHYKSDCSLDGVFHAGDVFRETADEVHIGRNLGTTPVVGEVLYVMPAGSPFSQDAPDPGCGV